MMGAILNLVRQILGAILYLLWDCIDVRDAGVKLNPFRNKVSHKKSPRISKRTNVAPIFFTIDKAFSIAQELINLVTLV